MTSDPKIQQLQVQPSLKEKIFQAVESAREYLFKIQHPKGYWVGELEADTTLESDTIKLDFILGRQDLERIEKLAQYILNKQLPDGGWNLFHDGPSELNATVKAYFALKLAGRSSVAPYMKKAREVILSLGGLEKINSFEKIYLAIFGQYPWKYVPALPPEMVLLPARFPFSIYEVSAWSRTILVPLSIIWATKPNCPVPQSCQLDELWATRLKRPLANQPPDSLSGKFWRNVFLAVDPLLKGLEAAKIRPWRKLGLRAAEQWIRTRLADTDGLGAIFPAMMNAVIAMKALGYPDGNPLLEEGIQQLRDLEIEENGMIRVQPCFSPIWDTALAVYSLSQHPAPSTQHLAPLLKAADWLLSKEVRVTGDWKIKNPKASPSGWYFEFRNPFYPDVDDTAMVLLALLKQDPKNPKVLSAIERGVDWILSMQNDDGGWSSFDKNNNCLALTHFPFADHNAMLDPSAADITGRVLELLGLLGYREDFPQVARAITFLKQKQEPEGCWFGRWGVNYLYGTCFVLRGLAAVGHERRQDECQRASRWIRTHQNQDGGWGESCHSYHDPSMKGRSPSTASQTAWALMGLKAGAPIQWMGRWHETDEFNKGVEFLLETQTKEGSWEEPYFTGTGFPKVFYLKYHLYRIYFPLLALSEIAGKLKE